MCTKMSALISPCCCCWVSCSKVYLHLHNFEAVAGDYSRDAILAVRKISGSIGVYEVGPTGAPYQFAFDPRNKGI